MDSQSLNHPFFCFFFFVKIRIRSLEVQDLNEKVEALGKLLLAKDQEIDALRLFRNSTDTLVRQYEEFLHNARNALPQDPASTPAKEVSNGLALDNSVVNPLQVLDFLLPRRQKTANIVFFKTHKTGSTTLGSIFFRFGARHGCKFMVGMEHYTILQRDSASFGVGSNIHLQHHRPLGLSFDELVDTYSLYIRNPLFVSVLRNPMDRYISAYRYFWEPYFSSKFFQFLQDKRYHNQQAIDFGLHNSTLMTQFFSSGGSFDKMGPVLITEYFDEGLLLMKRKFNWDLQDILYIKLFDSCATQRNHDGKFVKCGPLVEASSDMYRKLITENNALDQVLYDAFLARYKEEVASMGPDFEEELKQFRMLRGALVDYCKDDLAAFLKNREAYLTGVNYCTQFVLDDLAYEGIIRIGKGVAQWVLDGPPTEFV